MDGQKRVVALLAACALFLAVFGLVRLATTPSMALLYAGLEPGSAAEVVRVLEQQGAAFDIRGNAIYVDTTQRDQLRLSLAGEGLPTNNSKGYELLDSLSGFGTTAQMFDAAYWRAKEGELARTIIAGSQFRTARVHISNVGSSAFRRKAPPTASVTVTGQGGTLSASHARALRFLVSSAVSGMTPDGVSVIDGQSGTMFAGADTHDAGNNSSDRASEMRSNVERLLEARVGVGNAIVEVNLDVSTDSEAITERKFDPDSRVAVSTQKEERSTNSNESDTGSVTVASNLPSGDAAGGSGNSSSQDTETSELTNYEFSETTRELVRGPGATQKLSIAVLVNGVAQNNPDTDDQILVPRSDEELAALRELVASAVGFNAERGDTIALKSMPFQTTEISGAIAEKSLLSGLNLDVMRLIQLAVLSIVSLVLGLFVLRPILSKVPQPPLLEGNPSALPNLARNSSTPTRNSELQASAALTGEIDDQNLPASNISLIGNDFEGQSQKRGSLQGGSDPVQQLREMIGDRQDESVEILKSWISDSEENA